MKSLQLFSLSLLLLGGCRRAFSPYLEKAQQSIAQKNYIDVIDTLNAGLPHWRESDGNDQKAQALQLLGKSYHQLRNTDKAMEAFLQAVKLSDKTFDSAYTLGIFYLAKNQPDLARKCFLDALRMKPDDPLALLGLGNSFYAEKKTQDAAMAFQKVLDVSPGVRDAMESLALIKAPHSKPNPKSSVKKQRVPAKKPFQRKKRSY